MKLLLIFLVGLILGWSYSKGSDINKIENAISLEELKRWFNIK